MRFTHVFYTGCVSWKCCFAIWLTLEMIPNSLGSENPKLSNDTNEFVIARRGKECFPHAYAQTNTKKKTLTSENYSCAPLNSFSNFFRDENLFFLDRIAFFKSVSPPVTCGKCRKTKNKSLFRVGFPTFETQKNGNYRSGKVYTSNGKFRAGFIQRTKSFWDLGKPISNGTKRWVTKQIIHMIYVYILYNQS